MGIGGENSFIYDHPVEDSKELYDSGEETESRDFDEIKVGETVKGIKLLDSNMVGISIKGDDIKKYQNFLTKRQVPYEIFQFIDNPELGLLVMDDSFNQSEVFDNLVDKGKIKGEFWSECTVEDNELLKKITGSIFPTRED